MQESEKLFEMASDVWQSAIDSGDFNTAILTGMSAYILLRAQNNERLAQGALNLVHVAIEVSQRTAGEKDHESSCSFCGRREPEVKLAAGPSAFICDM
jgi:ClpX C4-type zinc finger